MSFPRLEVSHLSTWLRTDRGTLRAVNDVSCTIGAGEALGIVGESGSGKSIFARSIMSLLPYNAVVAPEASVRFDGRELRGLRRRELQQIWGEQIAMVFQDPMTSLSPTVRVGREITESLRHHLGLSRDAADARALELLRQVGIAAPEQRMRSYPHELSGGMRQRIAIAVAIACGPKLLIADEPTTALDVTIQRQILDLLAQLQAGADMAMILITHDLGVVAGRTDRVLVMYAGRVVESAPTAVLFADTKHPYTEALLHSIPRLEHDTSQRLQAIPGRPPDLTRPVAGCPFAERCRYAQARCLAEDPPLQGDDAAGHQYACFFPVGTPEGAAALARNLAAGATATGRPITEMAEAR